MVNSYGLPECVDWVERESGWKTRKGKAAAARAARASALPARTTSAAPRKPVNWTGEPHATVKIKLDFDGSIVVLSGAADIGQGSTDHPGADRGRSARASISSRVRVVTGDSEVVPKDNGSYSSRVTFMVGNAAIDAAQQSQSACWSRRPRASSRPSPKTSNAWASSIAPARRTRALTFEEVVTEALKDTGTITVTGNYSTIPESHGGKKYRGAAIGGTMGYSYSAQVVEVSVDEETGVVTVDKVWVAHDCGKALNRLTVEGQVQGSVWMGMGQAMSEETAYHDGPDDHRPTCSTTACRPSRIRPPIEVGIVESNDPHGPFGAKEAGEGSLAAFLPALTNAIADAIGIRFNDLPVTPDRVFAAIEKRAARRQRGAASAARARLMDALPRIRARSVRRRSTRCSRRAPITPAASCSAAAPISSSISAAASSRRRC